MQSLQLTPGDFERALNQDPDTLPARMARLCAGPLAAFIAAEYSPFKVWRRAMSYHLTTHDLILLVQSNPDFATQAP